MPSILWKTIRFLFATLLTGALFACQSSTPSPSSILPSATPSPTLTPSAGRIAFYSATGPGETGKNDIYLIDSNGNNLVHLSDGWTPYWSPDGQRIAFGGGWIIKADGSDRQLFVQWRSGGDPPLAWSPDGQQIAFAVRQGNPAGSIYVVDVKLLVLDGDIKGSSKELVTLAVNAYDLAWSPDGKQLLFSYHDGDDDPNYIAVMNVATALTPQPYEQIKWKILDKGWWPAWSPDGKKIVYQSIGIQVMDANGSNKKSLTTESDTTPVWSPDGQKITFQSKRDGNWQIYVMNADGSNQTNITNNPASDKSALSTAPSWSPDGKQIAFVSKRDGNQEIYVMDADGSHLLRLTNNDVDDYGPVWQP